MAQHFTVTFRAASDRDGIHAMRALLKAAGRHFGLRAIDARETAAPLWRAAERVQISRAGKRMKMVDMRKYAGSAFIKCDDVRSGPLQEKIVSVEIGKYDKPNLIFESGTRLSANATNVKTLVRAFGRDFDSWIGGEIELHLGTIEFQGKDQEAVLLRAISEVAFGSSTPAKKKPAADPDPDETIPF